MSELRAVHARPVQFEFDPSKTALIVVDMQNDFGSDGGMFHLAGIDIAPIKAIVPNVRRVISACRQAGVGVIYLKMGFHPDLADAGFPGSPTWLKHAPMRVGDAVIAPNGEPSQILIRDCWNTDIVEELRPEPQDTVLYKHRYSGFFETDLDGLLRNAGVERLPITGATTSVCVDSTVRDAMFRDYHCLVLSDATAEPIAIDAPRSNHEASLLVFELLFAQVATTADLLAVL